MENSSKTALQAIYNLLSQVILNGTSFILTMLFTRVLSVDNYGIVSIYQAYTIFFSILVGLNTQGSIGTAFVHIDKKKHNDYLSSIMLLSVIGFVVIVMICTVIMPWLSKFSQLRPSILVLMMFHSFGIFTFNFASIKYTYSKKAQYGCLLSLIVSLLMFLLYFVTNRSVNYFQEPYMIRILGLAIPYIICGIYVLTVIFIKGNPFASLKKFWSFCIPICMPLIFHGISNVILSQTDKVMIQKLMNDNGQVGIYSFTVTFVHILNSIYIALNNTWVPIFYDYMKENNIEPIRLRAKRYLNLFTSLVVGFIMVAPEFIKWFADSAYWGGITLIPVIALSQYMILLYSFAVNFEFYNRSSKWIAAGTTLAAICNIILNVIFIPLWGTSGAAAATLISYAFLYFFHDKCARKIKNLEYPFPKIFFMKNTVILIFFCILAAVLSGEPVIRWIVAVLDGIILLKNIYENKSFF